VSYMLFFPNVTRFCTSVMMHMTKHTCPW
jgi:hypothetical protein